MTRDEIIYNYDQAIRQASKMDDVAKKLEKLASGKMGNVIAILKGAWQSDNSMQYYEKVGKEQGDMRSTAKKLRIIAQNIRTTAQAVKKAELRALEIAQARSYR